MGVLLCLVSAACFGAMAVFGKLAYAEGVSPEALLLLRFGLAAALLGGLQLVRRRSAPRLPREGVRRLVLTALALGAVGYALQATLYFAALERLDAPVVGLVFYTYPVLVALVAALLGRERLTRRRGAALAVASAGTALVLLGAGDVALDALGVVLALGTAVAYTGYILVSDSVVHRVPPVALAALVMTGAAGALALRAALTGGVDLGLTAAGWGWTACIAVVSTVVAMLAFFAGLARTGPSAASILSAFEPVVTTALAAVVLGELLRPAQLAGALVVLSSVAVLQVRPRRRRATAAPEPLAVPYEAVAR